jgi:prophage DNA circulation protein
MGSIRDIKNEWRDSLVLASFRNVEFHVEMGSMSSGRRTVVFEYPKRDLPYSEDMGRSARRWQFTAYLLLRDYGLQAKKQYNIIRQRDNLIAALEKELAGVLIHPDLGQELVMCERYTYSEQRDRGGYFMFEMQFVEGGKPVLSQSLMNFVQQIEQAATNAENTGMQKLEDGIVDFPFVRGGTQ